MMKRYGLREPLPVQGTVMQDAHSVKHDFYRHVKRVAIRQERVLSLFMVTTPLEEVRPSVPAPTCGHRAGKTSVLSSA
jgi:hypothetical protein